MGHSSCKLSPQKWETSAMAMRIDIIRKKVAGGPGIVEFRPTEVVIPSGESVYWRNLDPLEAHHIDLFPKDPRYILHPYGGEPPAMTPTMGIRTTKNYSCRLHAAESGRITVL